MKSAKKSKSFTELNLIYQSNCRTVIFTHGLLRFVYTLAKQHPPCNLSRAVAAFLLQQTGPYVWVTSLRVLTWLSPKLSSAKKFNPGVSILRKVLLLSTTVRSESCPRRSERSRNSKVLCSLPKAANNQFLLYVNSCVLINVNNEYQKQVTGTALKALALDLIPLPREMGRGLILIS